MTNDKIKKYIGENIFNHISSLDAENLTRMKKNIISDINLHAYGSEILFKRTVELEYINKRLTN